MIVTLVLVSSDTGTNITIDASCRSSINTHTVTENTDEHRYTLH